MPYSAWHRFSEGLEATTATFMESFQTARRQQQLSASQPGLASDEEETSHFQSLISKLHIPTITLRDGVRKGCSELPQL